MKKTRCDCGAEFVFLPTRAGKFMPVNLESLSETDVELLSQRDEVHFRHDEHEAHFATCPNANQHRRE